MNQDTTLTPKQLPSSESNLPTQWGEKFVKFMKKYPATNRTLAVRNLADAASRGGLALASMDKYFGEGSCVYWLKTQLIALFEYMGLFKAVTEYQIKTLAERIKSKYYYLTPAELMVFFENFSDGDYALFRSQTAVNPQMLMVSLPHFVADVQEARAQAEREANNRKAEEERQKYLSSPHHSIEDNKKRLESIRNQINESNSVNTALYGTTKSD